MGVAHLENKMVIHLVVIKAPPTFGIKCGYYDTFFSHEKMGVVGTLEYISDLMSNGHKHNNKKKTKKQQLQTVDLKVRMDCDGCELKVKNALTSLSGMHPNF